MSKEFDYIIIGAGVIGLTIAYTIKQRNPSASILIIDKEDEVACHASGRNSGVLHAGFYYSADSLKAKLTVEGNRAMKEYCREKGLPVNESGKLVVAQNAEELEQLFELERRGKSNGSNVTIITEEQASEIEPNIRTHQKALHSPDTASIDPIKVCRSLRDDLLNLDVEFSFETAYLGKKQRVIKTNRGDFAYKKVINCAGLYADKLAQEFGLGKQYTIIPFKGLYLKYTKNKTDVKVNIYPVPNLRNPFLGVHFTKTVTDDIKIGPTAIPAFWRENYQNLENFSFGEMATICLEELKLFTKNSFGFRDLAFEEMRKYNKNHFIRMAQDMVQNIDPKGFTEFTKPGIRAQLLDKNKSLLVQDFVVEGDDESVHILNAVSPAFTCAFPFAAFVFDSYVSP